MRAIEALALNSDDRTRAMPHRRREEAVHADVTFWPRITIVTPTYNQAAYLDQAIGSIVSQKYPNLEYIVLDAGSTDGTVEIIKKYSHAIAHWRSGPDDGPYAAINEGLSRATGEICAWLNGDDMYFPGALHCVGAIFSGLPDVNWLTTLSRGGLNEWGDLSVEKLSGVGRGSFWDGRHFPVNRARMIGFIQQESTFFRTSLWKQSAGLRRDMPLAADFGLWCDFFARSEIHATRRLLGAFRMHATNRSRNIDAYIREGRQHLASIATPRSTVLSLPALTARVPRLDSVIARFQKAAEWMGYEGREVSRETSGALVSRTYRYL